MVSVHRPLGELFFNRPNLTNTSCAIVRKRRCARLTHRLNSWPRIGLAYRTRVLSSCRKPTKLFKNQYSQPGVAFFIFFLLFSFFFFFFLFLFALVAAVHFLACSLWRFVRLLNRPASRLSLFSHFTRLWLAFGQQTAHFCSSFFFCLQPNHKKRKTRSFRIHSKSLVRKSGIDR